MLKTKYDEIDKNLKIKDNDLIVVAGVEGIGKTNFISNIIVNMEKPVLLFAPKENADKFIKTIVSIQEFDNAHSKDAATATDTKNIIIEDTNNIEIQEIILKSEKIKKERNIEFIIIDYRQLYYELNEDDIKQLKILSQKLNIPIILIINLPDEVKTRRNPIPIIKDLKNKPLIKIADVILFLHRDDYYNEDSDKRYILYIIIAKPFHKKIELISLDRYNKIANLLKIK